MMESGFEATLSAARFARYLEWAEGDRVRALELYALNTRLPVALYTPPCRCWKSRSATVSMPS